MLVGRLPVASGYRQPQVSPQAQARPYYPPRNVEPPRPADRSIFDADPNEPPMDMIGDFERNQLDTIFGRTGQDNSRQQIPPQGGGGGYGTYGEYEQPQPMRGRGSYGGGYGGGFNPMMGGGLGSMGGGIAQLLGPLLMGLFGGGFGGGYGGYGGGQFGGYGGGGFNPMFGGLGGMAYGMGMNPMMGPQFMQQMPQQYSNVQQPQNQMFAMQRMLAGRGSGSAEDYERGFTPNRGMTAPPGMEARQGMGGTYFVPQGTAYNPEMD